MIPVGDWSNLQMSMQRLMNSEGYRVVMSHVVTRRMPYYLHLIHSKNKIQMVFEYFRARGAASVNIQIKP